MTRLRGVGDELGHRMTKNRIVMAGKPLDRAANLIGWGNNEEATTPCFPRGASTTARGLRRPQAPEDPLEPAQCDATSDS